MPCLLALLAFFFPRLVLILLALFSTYLHSAFQTWLWPLLGFFFAPFTTLAYAWAINSHGTVSGFPLAVIIFALLLDLGVIGGGARAKKRRRGN